MKGMILAAGLGTRLRPLTRERPKAAVPVALRPACVWAARALLRAGVSDVAVNLHHMPDAVRAALGDGRVPGLTLHWSHESGRILGTGGGIRRALDLIGRGPLVVVNGDVVSDIDIALLVEHHERAGAPATLALVAHPDPSRYGTVTLHDGYVTSIAGRRSALCPEPAHGETDTVFTGISVLASEALALLPDQGCLVRETFFSLLAGPAPLAGYLHAGFWSDIGAPREYLRCTLDILRGRAGALEPPRVLEHGRLIGDNVRIGDGARVGPDVVLGHGAVVESGADLGECVVWDGATATGRLRRAVVGRRHVVQVEDA
jgi:NDP-sugar pyrophosphorylase family protein